MEKFKGKYEIILGFVTLIISLSAFKDELKKISVDTIFLKFTLSDYFLYSVCGFSVCLYLYIIEHVVRDTRIGNWKIFDYVVQFAYFLFILTRLSPFLIVFALGSTQIYLYILSEKIQNQLSPEFLGLIVSLIISLIVNVISSRLYRATKKEARDKIEEKQIKEIDNASKLFQDNYFSHSILESYKAIESFLYKKILERGIRVQPNRFPDLIKIALNEQIISQDEVAKINDIRGMRNAAAHTDATYTKQQAEFALDIVKGLFRKN